MKYLTIAEREDKRRSEVSLGYIFTSLGNLYSCLGEYEKAKGYLDIALKTRIKVHGPKASLTCDTRNVRGDLLRRMKKFKEAAQELRAARAIREEILEAGSTRIAASDFNLGLLLLDQGHPEEAQEKFTRALGIQERQSGTFDIRCARIHLGLAASARALKNLSTARRHAETALSLRKRQVAPNSTLVMDCYIEQSLIEAASGNSKKAHQLMARASAGYQESGVPTHPHLKLATEALARY